jgi:hypothetical protein
MGSDAMRCARGGRSTSAMAPVTGASAALGRAFVEALPLGTGPMLTALVYGLKAALAQP